MIELGVGVVIEDAKSFELDPQGLLGDTPVVRCAPDVVEQSPKVMGKDELVRQENVRRERVGVLLPKLRRPIKIGGVVRSTEDLGCPLERQRALLWVFGVVDPVGQLVGKCESLGSDPTVEPRQVSLVHDDRARRGREGAEDAVAGRLLDVSPLDRQAVGHFNDHFDRYR